MTPKNLSLNKDKTDQKQIAELHKQLEDCTNRWKRVLADYQNLEKRVKEDQEIFVKFAIKQFIQQLLPAVDDLEAAQSHLKNAGLDLAMRKLAGVLQLFGLKRIETKGKQFDIHSMEAISIVDGQIDNQVVEELRPGYSMHGSVIRPAQVTVSKKKV